MVIILKRSWNFQEFAALEEKDHLKYFVDVDLSNINTVLLDLFIFLA